jgi:hypothetical protein
VVRFDLRRQKPALLALRDDLYRAGLACAEAVADLYERADDFDLPDELDDRGRDIFEPLYAVAAVVDRQRGDGTARLAEAVQAFARSQAGTRGAEEQQGAAGRVARALANLHFSNGSIVVTSSEMLTLLREHAELPLATAKQAGMILSGMGLHSSTHRVAGEPARGYRITWAAVQELVDRFADGAPCTVAPAVTSVTSAQNN